MSSRALRTTVLATLAAAAWAALVPPAIVAQPHSFPQSVPGSQAAPPMDVIGPAARAWLDAEDAARAALEAAVHYGKTAPSAPPFMRSLAEMVDKVRSDVALETLTDVGYANDDDLFAIDDQTRAMADVAPPTLRPLLERESIREYAASSEEPGGFVSPIEEVERLAAIGDTRGRVIDEMKATRDRIRTVAEAWRKQEKTAFEYGRELDALNAANPEIDLFLSMLAAQPGKFSLSILFINEELVPALERRASAAEDVAERFDKAIKTYEKDLKDFRDINAFFRRIYSSDPADGDPLGLDARAVDPDPGAVARLRARVDATNAQTAAAAAELRRDAEKDRRRYGQIAGLRTAVGAARLGVQGAQTFGAGASTPEKPEGAPPADAVAPAQPGPAPATPSVGSPARAPSPPQTIEMLPRR